MVLDGTTHKSHTGYMSSKSLKRWLQTHQLTQEEFAAKTGITRDQVSRIAAGKRRVVRIDVAMAIERATGIPARSWSRKQ